ncbi:MAG: NBR1-Ig-like domain-containing protein [Anaerolineales bacterium]|nr:NBR1-Ig-like domain-containing protein [Anaerolineales bacterium]
MRKTMFVWLTLALILTACLPGQSPEEVQSQINTAVAQTLEARQQIEDSVAQTVAAQSLLITPTAESTQPPTNTPLAFPTLTAIIPTVTAFPVNPPSSGGSGTSYQADYACDIINSKPRDNTEYNKGAKFDIKWTIVNTGKKTWEAGYDVKYYSGPKMTSLTVVEIPKEMKPKATYEINLDAVVPDEKGFQVMTWTVQGQLCYPYVAIIVR